MNVCLVEVHGWGLSCSPWRGQLGLFVKPLGDQFTKFLQAMEVIKFSQMVSVLTVLDYEAECLSPQQLTVNANGFLSVGCWVHCRLQRRPPVGLFRGANRLIVQLLHWLRISVDLFWATLDYTYYYYLYHRTDA